HTNSDLACASRHRIRFDSVETNDGQTKRQSPKDGEQSGAGANKPKVQVRIKILGKCLQRHDRDCGIDIAHRASQQIGRAGFASGGKRTESDKKGNVALESTRKREVNRAVRLFVSKKIVAGYGNDPDYFDRLVLLLLFTQLGARSTGGASATLPRRRIFARILNALSKSVAIRPKPFGQRLINDCHSRTRLCRLRLGKCATTQHRQSNGGKIICAHAV